MMSAVDMQGLIGQMQALAGQAGGKPARTDASAGDLDFGSALRTSINRINDLQQAAKGESQAFQAGVPGVALYDVMIDTQKASLAMQMGVQVRNRLVSAYKQIMTMQV